MRADESGVFAESLRKSALDRPNGPGPETRLHTSRGTPSAIRPRASVLACPSAHLVSVLRVAGELDELCEFLVAALLLGPPAGRGRQDKAHVPPGRLGSSDAGLSMAGGRGCARAACFLMPTRLTGWGW